LCSIDLIFCRAWSFHQVHGGVSEFILVSRRAWCFHQVHGGVSISNSVSIVVVLGDNTKHGSQRFFCQLLAYYYSCLDSFLFQLELSIAKAE